MLDTNTPRARPETGDSCYIPWKIVRQKVTCGRCHCRAIVSRHHCCARSLTNAQVSFSPDGRWIAYISDESGTDEIYVREFYSGSAQGPWDAGSKWLISKGGGTDPRWRGDGKELFY